MVVASDGVRVAVREFWGQGAALIMAHGIGFHGLVWEPVAELLAPSFRCVAVDLRGHGDSGLPRGHDFEWRGFARDVLAVVDGLGLTGAFGLGHSLGATALLLAEQARPGTFSALYCFEPVVVPADPPLGRDADSWLAALARRRRDVFPSREDAYRNYLTKMPSVAAQVLARYVEAGFEDPEEGGVRLKCLPETEALIYEMATAHDCFTRLSDVACPVTLGRGETSDAMDWPTVEAIQRRLPRCRASQVPGVGHLGPLEDPGTVANDVVTQLRC